MVWMPELDDQQLLQEFAGSNSEAAFATLVARYVNLVYSTALRFSGNPHRAEEITQAVFIILARKAGGWRRGAILSGWLYQTARLTAANVVKGEVRRQRREQEAGVQSMLNEPEEAAWEQIAPLLDDAMGRLGETDRNAVVLRFFENKTAREVAAALKLTEGAAHKRVNRALEKLRKFFASRGITSTTGILAGAISANSIQAAPMVLAKGVTVVALAKGAAASASTLTLVKGALKVMAWTKAKMIVAVALAIIVVGSTATVLNENGPRQQNLWVDSSGSGSRPNV
jgi:RNA polymerase sigma factor (sigma-70 family)